MNDKKTGVLYITIEEKNLEGKLKDIYSKLYACDPEDVEIEDELTELDVYDTLRSHYDENFASLPDPADYVLKIVDENDVTDKYK